MSACVECGLYLIYRYVHSFTPAFRGQQKDLRTVKQKLTCQDFACKVFRMYASLLNWKKGTKRGFLLSFFNKIDTTVKMCNFTFRINLISIQANWIKSKLMTKVIIFKLFVKRQLLHLFWVLQSCIDFFRRKKYIYRSKILRNLILMLETALIFITFVRIFSKTPNLSPVAVNWEKFPLLWKHYIL